MRRPTQALGLAAPVSLSLALPLALALALAPGSARAAEPVPTSGPVSSAVPPPGSAPAPAPPVAPAAPAPVPEGLAVVAVPGATGAAWPLARALYADASLRPASIDEAHARVLCGEAPPSDAPTDLRDLADSIAAIHGDDAPSRLILDDLTRQFALRGVVVVRTDAGHPTARVFVPDARTFDAATYAPDDASGLAWSAAERSLGRAFGSGGAPSAVPALATREAPKKKDEGHGKAFYESGWFWGALGAAVLAGGAAFLATRDSSASTIHLDVQVPR